MGRSPGRGDRQCPAIGNQVDWIAAICSMRLWHIRTTVASGTPRAPPSRRPPRRRVPSPGTAGPAHRRDSRATAPAAPHRCRPTRAGSRIALADRTVPAEPEAGFGRCLQDHLASRSGCTARSTTVSAISAECPKSTRSSPSTNTFVGVGVARSATPPDCGRWAFCPRARRHVHRGPSSVAPVSLAAHQQFEDSTGLVKPSRSKRIS